MKEVLEKAILASVSTFIILISSYIYKSGKQKKEQYILNGKIYYGPFRMIGLYLLALMSGELILMALLVNSNVDGNIALILVLICSVPIMILYLYFYRKHFKKLISKRNDE